MRKKIADFIVYIKDLIRHPSHFDITERVQHHLEDDPFFEQKATATLMSYAEPRSYSSIIEQMLADEVPCLQRSVRRADFDNLIDALYVRQKLDPADWYSFASTKKRNELPDDCENPVMTADEMLAERIDHYFGCSQRHTDLFFEYFFDHMGALPDADRKQGKLLQLPQNL